MVILINSKIAGYLSILSKLIYRDVYEIFNIYQN